MSAKIILVFCAQALFVQSALSQCTSRAAVAASPGIVAPALGYVTAPNGLAAPALASPYGRAAPCGFAAPAMDFTPTSGGGLSVTSASATAPVGLSITSENVYEGILISAGELPFVGTVAVDGTLPTAGGGAVNHACGNGINAMAAETTAFAPSNIAAISPLAGVARAAAIAPGIAPALAAPYDLDAPCSLTDLDIDFTPTSGGILPVTSASSTAPVGLSVASDNVYEGTLAAGGELPFVGTVAVEGILPTAGAGAVNHDCGNGINAMAAETTAFAPGYRGAIAPTAAIAPFAGIAPAATIAPGLGASGFGYRAGWARRGCAL